jgi:hypothetical protein
MPSKALARDLSFWDFIRSAASYLVEHYYLNHRRSVVMACYGIRLHLSMLVFVHFEKVALHWGGPRTIISILSPVFYFISGIAMMGEVTAALRTEDPAIYETYVALTYWIHFL